MDSSAGPEMISGVRASSIRMLSTSSTTAIVVPALHHRRELELHVVAEIVEAELVVGSVGDVGAVGDLPLLVVEIVLDDADAHAEEPVEASHPFRVAARQVVVHRDDVNALALERVEIDGERGDERLAFAGLHLGDLAFVQHHAAHQLDVEVPHVQHAPAGLAHDRERFRQQSSSDVAVGDALPEFDGLAAELFVGERLDRRLERVDFRDERTQTLDFPFVLGADDLGE